MAFEIATGYVSIVPSMAGFSQKLSAEVSRSAGLAGDQAGKSYKSGIMSHVKSIAAGFVAGFAATKGIAFFQDSIKAASDLNESLNAVNVTFGKNAKGVQALGDKAAQALGLSKNEFNGLAVQFSNFATTVAGKNGDVVGTLDELTTRASDFASVMNLDVKQSAELFQSGLAGETEPLRKYGIDLSAAAVQAHALAKGIWNGSGEMTEAQKVQARYSLLMKSTAKTAGDFANTSDSLANRQRIANAQWENAKSSIGQALLPVMQAVTGFIQEKVVPAVQAFGDWFTRDGMPALTRFGGVLRDTVLPVLSGVVGWLVRNKDVLLPIAGIIGAMVLAYKTWAFVSGIVTTAQIALNFALPANPIGIVVVAIAGLVAALVLLWNKNEGFRNFVIGAWTAIKDAAMTVWNAIKGVIQVVWDAISWYVTTYINVVKTVISTAWDWIKAITQTVWDAISWYVTTYINVVKTVISTAWDVIKAGTQLAWDAIKTLIINPVVAVWTRIVEVIGNVREWLSTTWGTIRERASTAWQNVKDAIVGPISNLWNRLADFLGEGGTVRTKLAEAWESIKNKASEMWGNVKNAVTKPISELWDAFKSLLGLKDDGGYTEKGALGKLVGVFGAVVTGISGVFGGIQDAITTPIIKAFKWVNVHVIDFLNSGILSKFGDNVKIPHLPEKFAKGGLATGPRSGYYAELHGNEFIVNEKQTRANYGLLSAINAGRGAGPSLLTSVMNWQPPDVGDSINRMFKKGAKAAVNMVGNPALEFLRGAFGSAGMGGNLAITAFSTLLDGVRAWADDLRLAPTELMEALAKRFEGMLGSFVGFHTCLRNVNLALQALGQRFGFAVNGFAQAGTAWQAGQGVLASGQMHRGIDAPRGSIVYWNPGIGNYAGHIAVADGRGNFLNNFGGSDVDINKLANAQGGYVGWSYPWALIAGGKKYDSGGYLQPGWNATYNGTGRPEPVLTSQQWDALTGSPRVVNNWQVDATTVPTEEATMAAWRRWEALQAV